MTQYTDRIALLTISQSANHSSPTGIAGMHWMNTVETSDWGATVEDLGSGARCLTLSRSTAGLEHIAMYFDTPGTFSGNVEVLCKFQLASLDAAGVQATSFIAMRMQNVLNPGTASFSHYGGTWRATGPDTFAAGKWNDTSFGSLGTGVAPGSAFAASPAWFWMRAKVVTDTTSIKIWKDGDSEPGSFGGDNTPGATLSSGYVGFNIYNYTNAPIKFGYFSVGTGGDSAPAPGSSPAKRTNRRARTIVRH